MVTKSERSRKGLSEQETKLLTELASKNKKIKISSKEKTIADCLDLPKYSGGIEETAKGLKTDLDLTATKEITKEEYREVLKSSLNEASRVSGITFEIKNLYMNPGYLQALIQYEALLGQKNTTKLDITLVELVYSEPEQKAHSFEDVWEFDIKIYSLEEILVEKIRSLFERRRARDSSLSKIRTH